MKHTPARWRADINRARNICQVVVPVSKNQEATIAQVCGPFKVEEVEANARLMARAPELLLLLEGVLWWAENPTQTPDEGEARAQALADAHTLIYEAQGWVYDEELERFVDPTAAPEGDCTG